MPLLLGLCAIFLSFFSFFTTVTAFTYSFGTPSECDDLPLTWTGGTAPFSLMIVPVFGTPQNISIPDSAFSNGKGSYSFQLPIAKDSQFVFAMSDATGFNTGGTTKVLTTKASTSGASCNTADPATAFLFQLNTALQQCRPFTFSGFREANQPVTIAALIPGGAATVLRPPVGSSNYDWTAAVAHGTSMIFLMTDAQGRSGGSSDVRLVAASDDATCLNANSPATTTNPPAITQTATKPTSSSTPAPSPTTPSSSPSPSTTTAAGSGFTIAAIAGTVIGSLLFLAMVITLGLFFLRKKRDSEEDIHVPPGGGPPGGHGRRFGSGALELNNTSLQPGGSSPYGAHPSYDQGGAYAPPHLGSTNTFAASNPFLDDPSQQSLSYPSGNNHYDARYGGSQYEPSELGHYSPQNQYQHAGNPQGSVPLYPPTNYSPNPPPSVDPFSLSGAPMLPAMYHSPPQLYPPSPLPPVATDPFESHETPGSSHSDLLPYLQPSSSNVAQSTTMSGAQRKAAMAGETAYKPARFILHTDVEDDLPPPADDEIVELPPQYSERRGPPAALGPSSPPLTTIRRPYAPSHPSRTDPFAP